MLLELKPESLCDFYQGAESGNSYLIFSNQKRNKN